MYFGPLVLAAENTDIITDFAHNAIIDLDSLWIRKIVNSIRREMYLNDTAQIRRSKINYQQKMLLIKSYTPQSVVDVRGWTEYSIRCDTF